MAKNIGLATVYIALGFLAFVGMEDSFSANERRRCEAMTSTHNVGFASIVDRRPKLLCR
jgi:hypothetical protein